MPSGGIPFLKKLSCLIKDGLCRANEAPIEHLLFTIGIGDGVANMENLAFIGDISVVSVGSSVARKLIDKIVSNGSRITWKS
jgi:hypothetical protein